MNTPPANPKTPDELDRLFSGFFKAQLKHPWPNAPLPPAGNAVEPSELVAARSAGATQNVPTPTRTEAAYDSTARARFTLAASVALMLGTCWYLSNGFESGTRPIQGAPNSSSPMLQDSGADASKHIPLQQIGADKAKENPGPKVEPFDMGKIGE
jgi:hypothetical protein